MDKYYYCYGCDYDYIYGVIFVFRDNSLFFLFSKIVLLLAIGIALLLPPIYFFLNKVKNL